MGGDIDPARHDARVRDQPVRRRVRRAHAHAAARRQPFVSFPPLRGAAHTRRAPAAQTGLWEPGKSFSFLSLSH
jgi:hypothetical protein